MTQIQNPESVNFQPPSEEKSKNLASSSSISEYLQPKRPTNQSQYEELTDIGKVLNSFDLDQIEFVTAKSHID